MTGPLQTLLGMLGLTGAVGCGLLFVTGSLGKLRHAGAFRGVVANYRLLPEKLVAPVAMLLPWAELMIGVALLAGFRLAAPPAECLLAAFAAAISINLRRGRTAIDCGCTFGDRRNPIHPGMVWRNLALAAMVSLRAVPVQVDGVAIAASAAAAGVAILILVHLQDSIVLLSLSPLAVAHRH